MALNSEYPSEQEQQLSTAGRQVKGLVDKAHLAGNMLRAGNEKSILNANERAANSYLHAGDSKHILNGNKNKTYYKSSALNVEENNKITKRGNLSRQNGHLESKIEKNSAKMDRLEKKINKKMKNRYYRDYQIKGGIASKLRLETDMKSKLRSSGLPNAAGGITHIAADGLNRFNNALKTDSMGIQHGLTDAANKAANAAAGVYKVSKAAIHFRSMQKERSLARMLSKETKLMKKTFKMEYRQAFRLFKESAAGQSASFLEKQKYKKFLKKKYMKNAMKQYQAAKKAGQAGKAVFSTGLSAKDSIKKVLDVLKNILIKSKLWIVLLIIFALSIIPHIFSSLMILLMGILGGDAEQKASSNYETAPETVMQWEEWVTERCNEINNPGTGVDLTQFTDAILAIIWQESGGACADGDIMQCRACGLWDDSKIPDGWTVEQYSIDVGIRYFYNYGLTQWKVDDPEDYDGLQMVAQGYNYGYGFWDFDGIIKGETKWSLELSKAFQSSKGGNYGHAEYGQEWLDKYMAIRNKSAGNVDTTKGPEGVMQTALNQEGISESPPDSNNVIFNTDYYGKEVHDGDCMINGEPSAYPWCCVFVWWCFNKSGNGAAFYNGGKVAGCQAVANWAESNRLWINKSEAKAGDLLLFKSGSGYSHIEIVTGVEGNIIHTIGGNTTPEAGSGNEYNGGTVAARNRTYSNTTHRFVRPQWDKVENK